MKFDWERLLSSLRSYPKGVHNVLPPCSQDRLSAMEAQLGNLPGPLGEMLGNFNGAELFISGLPLVTVFGISTVPPLPPLDWGPEWYIDILTPKWRAGGSRQLDWAIAMTNYGGLIVLDEKARVKEWDTSESKWSPRNTSFDQWIAEVLREGDAYLSE